MWSEYLSLYMPDFLAYSEASFIIASLLFVHWIRNYIGKYTIYLCFGGLFVLSQIISASELNLIKWGFDSTFHVSGSIFFIPLLGTIMVVYVSEGTLAMQKLIMGVIICFLMFIYLSYVTYFQHQMGTFLFARGGSALLLEVLFAQSTKFMTGTALALLIDLFALPIIFQKLKNMRFNFFLSILCAMIITALIDAFISTGIVFWNDPQWFEQITSSALKKLVIVLIVSMFVAFYLQKIEKESHIEGKGSLDVLFAFFGKYGMARTLQKDITEWEGRYRLIIENASDMIFIVNREGKILDANPATIDVLKAGTAQGRYFPSLVDDFSVVPCLWDNLWKEADERSISSSEALFVSNKQLKLKIENNRKIEVDAAFSRGFIHHTPVMIIVCRNMTEQNRLKKEKEELTNQLYHTQRIESIGRLAGGVAHEFNNIIHAIQGHLELMMLFGNIEDTEVEEHLKTIEKLTERAGVITSQLLGFARNSKRNESKIDLREVVSGTEEMFVPLTKRTVEVSIKNPDYACYVNGDFVQLQQVFLNILINALDAVNGSDKNDKKITITTRKAVKLPAEMKLPSIDIKPSDFYEVTISDNGIGMDAEVMKRIFEPFYTTKEVGKGTGMGLAMVYGEITAHHGYVSVTSQINQGTAFSIYLPINKI